MDKPDTSVGSLPPMDVVSHVTVDEDQRDDSESRQPWHGESRWLQKVQDNLFGAFDDSETLSASLFPVSTNCSATS